MVLDGFGSLLGGLFGCFFSLFSLLGSRGALGGPLGPPGSIFVDSGVDLGSILGGFGMLWGAFGEHFPVLFSLGAPWGGS